MRDLDEATVVGHLVVTELRTLEFGEEMQFVWDTGLLGQASSRLHRHNKTCPWIPEIGRHGGLVSVGTLNLG